MDRWEKLDQAFDFDKLKRLAETNPELFETLRADLIEQAITLAPRRSQRRLRGTQFKIDSERRLAKNPVGACVRISRLMWESLGSLQDALESLNSDQPQPAYCPVPAKVISLPTVRR
jgi:hypothetical protein